jgi:hypothetical protein
MADYTDNALLASIKALDQVVLPAVDPADPLAGEQLRLVSGFLKFLRSRLPAWHARQRFELQHYLNMAQQLAADARGVSDEVSQGLDAAIDAARTLQAREAASVAEIVDATAALAAPISALARTVATGPDELRRRVEREVMAGSKRWVDMQRAWFLPQGFELHAGELPSLDASLVACVPARSIAA